jgi:hypothetical protein
VAADAGYYLSYDWLRSEEARPDETVSYFLIRRSASGGLVAGMAIKLVQAESSSRYEPSELGLRPPGGGPFGLIGSHRGHRGGVIRARLDRPEEFAVSRLLGAAIAEFRLRHGVPLYSLYVPDDALGNNMSIPGCTGARLISFEGYLPLPAGGYDEVVRRQRRRRRMELNRERRKFLEGEYAIAVEPLHGLEADLGKLLAQLEERHGGGNPASHYTSYFDRLIASGQPGQVLTCRLKDALVGFCHFYVFGGTVWCRTAGFDYPALRGRFEYFNLVFHELSQVGARMGASELHYGIGSIEAKVNHGALVRQLWALTFGDEG